MWLEGLARRAYELPTPLLPVTDETVRVAFALGASALGANDRTHVATCRLNGIGRSSPRTEPSIEWRAWSGSTPWTVERSPRCWARALPCSRSRGGRSAVDQGDLVDDPASGRAGRVRIVQPPPLRGTLIRRVGRRQWRAAEPEPGTVLEAEDPKG